MGRESKSSLFHAHVENFCCLFNVTGEDMLSAGRQQATNFGAQLLDEDVLGLSREEQIFNITTESGQKVETKTIIIATGTKRSKLGKSS
jgi:thioredoxin reductase (NADPH)